MIVLYPYNSQFRSKMLDKITNIKTELDKVVNVKIFQYTGTLHIPPDSTKI